MITVKIWYPVNSLLDSPATVISRGLVTELYPLPIPNYRPPEEFSRFGHAGILFESVVSESGEPYADGYRAFWPGRGVDWTTPAPGRIVTSLEHDTADEGGPPSRSIVLHTGLNEALVYRYWNSLTSQPLDYSAGGFNCCTAVATSIRDGFPPGTAADAPAYSPLSFAGGWFPWARSNPYYLEEWVNEVNHWL